MTVLDAGAGRRLSTVAALAEGARHAWRAWGRTQWLALAVLAAIAVLPALGWVDVQAVAGWLYLALAASGLVLAVGFGGLPSLGQGAFMSIGALVSAVLAGRAGWQPMAALPVAVAVTLAVALVAGLSIVRLDRAFVAVSTLLLSWLVAVAAEEFPWLSGGSQGYVVSSPLGPTGHYELALALTAAVVGLLHVFAGSVTGIRLQAVRDDATAAAVLGVPGDRLRYGAFAVSAAIAGLAGALSVQLAGVSDPTAFGPVTSFQLLVAVLVGGGGYATAGAAGVAVLGALTLLADLFGGILGSASGQAQPILAATLLLVLLGLGIRVRRAPRRPRPHIDEPRGALRRPAALRARSLTKAYGAVRPLDGLDLEVRSGEVVAIVGANGSGKTTLLRAIGGALSLDEGEILLDGDPLPSGSPSALARRGIIRTLQRTAVFSSLTALETALVGASLHAAHSGPLRTLVSTPKARLEAPRLRGEALEALRTVGLEEVADRPAEVLDSSARRRLMLAAALAARPRLLLLDEPAAGLAAAELAPLAHTIRRVQSRGVSIVVVEHNAQLVSAIADRVVTLVDGRPA